VSISRDECAWYKTHSDNVEIIYPVFAVSKKLPEIPENRAVLRIGFLGRHGWFPNLEAVKLMINKILPLTSRRIDFLVVGDGWVGGELKTGLVANMNGRGVNIIMGGYMSDVGLFWKQIDLFVAPIVSGSGVNVKVCEALANKVPVLALPHATRGLTGNILSCGGLFVAHSEVDFAKMLDEFDVTTVAMTPPVEFTSEYANQRMSQRLTSLLNC
jgi:glycosyltransferase involved in cell wall biosynthesis